jgi:NitT/TauT family transport system substrate-binding protein
MNRRHFLRAGATAALAFGTRLRAADAKSAAPLEKVSIRFNWSWVGNYSPVVLGRERGYYKDVGIDLALGQGKGSGATIRQAGSKLDTFVWADTSALLNVAAQGVPVKAVMMLTKCNLGIVTLNDRLVIRSARDLVGKKVSATPGDGNTQIWPAVLAANGMKASDVELVYLDGTAAVAALRTGRVDAAFCGISDQPVTLRKAGFPAVAVTFADLGVPTLGSALITHEDTIREKADLVRRMVAATQRSWVAAMEEPKAAVQALVKVAETPLNADLLASSLEVFQGLATGAKPTGRVEPAAMQQTLDVLKQHGGLKTDRSADAFFTNQFIGA